MPHQASRVAQFKLSLFHYKRRVRSRCKTGHAGVGHGYSGSVPEGEGPVFLQAMGRCAKDAQRAVARLALTGEAVSKGRRSHVGRDASHHEFGEGINEKPALEWTGFLLHSLADFQTPNLVGCDRRECRNPAKGGRFGTSTGSVHASFTEI